MEGTTRRTDADAIENFDAALNAQVAKSGFHTEDVTQNDLKKMALPQLEGRLNFYEREAIFERNPRIRKECKVEADRTRNEIQRRKMYERAEADRVFE